MRKLQWSMIRKANFLGKGRNPRNDSMVEEVLAGGTRDADVWKLTGRQVKNLTNVSSSVS